MLSKLRLLARKADYKRPNLKKLEVSFPFSVTEHQQVRLAATPPHGPFDQFHPIRPFVDDSAKSKPPTKDEKHEFQAETKVLLDIVSKSLYSDKNVFLRELISNACDSLEKEKLRFLQCDPSREVPSMPPSELKIDVITNTQDGTVTIEDSGVGMTKDELISNLGTIARSGSKEFIENLKSKGLPEKSNAVIGQFGVGFYSVFMVANKVVVLSKSSKSSAYEWTSDGSSTYFLKKTEKASTGTRVTVYLKPEAKKYTVEATIEDLIKKHCGFVRFPINLNGRTINTVEPMWTRSPKEISLEEHNAFYQSISNCEDQVRFVLQYKTDLPITFTALLYFPSGKPSILTLDCADDGGLQLYTRRVMIKKRAVGILPRWLRFVKGVVDSEDLPLNLSRELLQNTPVIQKVGSILTSRIIKFLYEKSIKDKTAYAQFFDDYGIFLKEAVVLGATQHAKEQAAKLLLFESSKFPSGVMVSLNDYCDRMGRKQTRIYYLTAPSRYLAETSPYYEMMMKRDVEVLFCYENYDEVVLISLKKYNSCGIVSTEQELRRDAITSTETLGPDCLQQVELDQLMSWMEKALKGKVDSVAINSKLESYPCIVSVPEMALARHFVKTQAHTIPDDMKYPLLKLRLEINPRHQLMKSLSKLSTSNVILATIVTEQLLKNALVFAGLLEDPHKAVFDITKILELSLPQN